MRDVMETPYGDYAISPHFYLANLFFAHSSFIVY